MPTCGSLTQMQKELILPVFSFFSNILAAHASFLWEIEDDEEEDGANENHLLVLILFLWKPWFARMLQTIGTILTPSN